MVCYGIFWSGQLVGYAHSDPLKCLRHCEGSLAILSTSHPLCNRSKQFCINPSRVFIFIFIFIFCQGSVGPGGSVSTMSDNIWSTLRMTLSLMGKSELHKAVDTRDLDHLNALFQSDLHDNGAITV